MESGGSGAPGNEGSGAEVKERPLLAGRFELLEEIGKGGMGRVHKARQVDLDRIVALKGLRTLPGHDDFVARLGRESRMAGAGGHPNIVTVFEYFQHEGIPYISMEYLARGSLKPWLGHLSMAQLAGVLDGLLEGLTAVAPLGIVHRDIKPENVLVTEDGRVKITDFGIAKATARERFAQLASSTSIGVVGTPAYMAPEQAAGDAVDPRADLYSVGILAYEQLVGTVPFHETKAGLAMLVRHINEPVPSVLDAIPGLDPALADWVARLVERDPAARQPSARAACEELEEIALSLLGPRWRRESRLTDDPPGVHATMSVAAEALRSQIFALPLQGGAAEEDIAVPEGSESASHSETSEPVALSGDRIVREPLVPPERRVSPPGRGAQRAGASPKVEARIEPPGFRRRRPGALTVVAMLVLGGAGTAVGATLAPSSHRVPSPAPLTGSASTQLLQLSFPDGWRRVAATGANGADTSGALRLEAARTGASLEVGLASSSSPTLLPARVLHSLAHVPASAAASLGGRRYYRYLSLTPKAAERRISLYALPTEQGVIVGECGLPKQGALAANVECELILSSLELSGVRVMKLGPQPAYAAALNTALGAVADAPRRSQLSAKTSAHGQAQALGQIAAATAAALSTLRAARTGPAEAGTASAIRTALVRLRDAYGHMASAGGAEDASGYSRARREAGEAGRALERAVQGLRPFGYV